MKGAEFWRERTAPSRIGLAQLLQDRAGRGEISLFRPIPGEALNTVELEKTPEVYLAEAKVMRHNSSGHIYVMNPMHEGKEGIVIDLMNTAAMRNRLALGEERGLLRNVTYIDHELHLEPAETLGRYEALFQGMLNKNHYQGTDLRTDPLFHDIISNATPARRAATWVRGVGNKLYTQASKPRVTYAATVPSAE